MGTPDASEPRSTYRESAPPYIPEILLGQWLNPAFISRDAHVSYMQGELLGTITRLRGESGLPFSPEDVIYSARDMLGEVVRKSQEESDLVDRRVMAAKAAVEGMPEKTKFHLSKVGADNPDDILALAHLARAVKSEVFTQYPSVTITLADQLDAQDHLQTGILHLAEAVADYLPY